MPFFSLNSFIITTILFIWFNTDAFIEYLKLFKLDFFIIDYLKNSNGLTFPQYIFLKRPQYDSSIIKFLIKLISCPVCLGFILSIMFNLNVEMFPCYISTLILYFTIIKLKD